MEAEDENEMDQVREDRERTEAGRLAQDNINLRRDLARIREWMQDAGCERDYRTWLVMHGHAKE